MCFELINMCKKSKQRRKRLNQTTWGKQLGANIIKMIKSYILSKALFMSSREGTLNVTTPCRATSP